MDESFAKLRQKVFKALADQRSRPGDPARHQSVLAEYIRLNLEKSGIDEAAFTQSISLSAEETQRLLQGQLPEHILTDEVIQRIAHVLGCEANLIYIMLARPIPSNNTAANTRTDSATHSA